MKTILLSWDDLAAGKAVKSIKQTFARAGTPVVLAEADSRTKRSSGVSFKTLNLTFADGQKVSLDAKQGGDIFAVKLNGSILPLKNVDDHLKAIGEIVGKLDGGRKAFQAKLARVKVELPKGLKSTAKKQLDILKEKDTQLDVAIAEAVQKRDELKSMVAMDSANWSAEVDTNWHPKEGFFTQSADEIASGLKEASDDLQMAMARLNFYINRAGDNLSDDDKTRLESAKEKLSALYETAMDNADAIDPEKAVIVDGCKDNKPE